MQSLQHCGVLETVVLVTGGSLDPGPIILLPPKLSVTTLLLSDVHIPGTNALLQHFPSASTVLSFGIVPPEVISAPARLVSFFSRAAPLTDVEIRLRSYGLLPRTARPGPFSSIGINGTLVAVDVSASIVRDLFGNGLAAVGLHTLTRLGLPMPFGDFLALAWPRLTGLRVLVFYCDLRWTLAWPADIARTETVLECLRVEATCAPGVAAAPAAQTWKMPLRLALCTLCNACSGITRVVIAGLPFLTADDVHPGVGGVAFEPAAPAPRGRAYEPWYWDFNEDAALHV
ncbi:hypothetical protein AURDEDRAFT_184549 [Auricularia subglabra TFB-10046 SS5]|nr:hypothetical protein AURDEDRAFT_184549 [Auricularia subglabra TFB-10046 SS5]